MLSKENPFFFCHVCQQYRNQRERGLKIKVKPWETLPVFEYNLLTLLVDRSWDSA